MKRPRVLTISILFPRFVWLLVLSCSLRTGFAAESIRVMTFNIWVGGDAGKQPLPQTAEVIRRAKADVVGLQETAGYDKGSGRPHNGPKLSAELGWSYYDQGLNRGILSRFPIVTNTPGKWGTTIRLPSGREIAMFNVHFNHAPYQPYQLAGIPYGNGRFIKTAEEAIDEARKARGGEVQSLLAELKPALASGKPVFLTGDFNEPSHLDWTPRAAAAGKCQIAVEYPTTLAVVRAGMRDAFRTVFPDEVANRGYTWTPTTRPEDPKDRHDRIDFVLFAGANVTVKNCEIIGESTNAAHIVVQPYPSDHRAVVATMEFND